MPFVTLGLALSLALSGCAPPTELIVIVHADEALESSVQALEVRVGDEFDQREVATWPVVARLVGSESKDDVLLEITARTEDGAVIVTRARVRLVAEQGRQVRLWLHGDCLAVECPRNQSCGCTPDGCACADIQDIESARYQSYDPESVPDAGPDGGIDAGYDAGFDGGVDAGLCGDGRISGDESDVDCGGSCIGCRGGSACREASDCLDGLCGVAGFCLAESCGNDEEDLTESDVDCGGPCDPCGVGQACGRDIDCASRVCAEGVCRAESCGNDEQDGDETDLDCGGSCGGCGTGASCGEETDCLSLACRGEGTCRDACFAAFGRDCDDMEPTVLTGRDDGDSFGSAVVIRGELMVVGVPGEASSFGGVDGDRDDNGANNSGAVQVYRRDARGEWALEAFLKAADVRAGDLFGASVAFDGETLAVGAPWRDGLLGVAYVFRRSPAGVWSQEAALSAAGLVSGDEFGKAVALHGDWVAVAAAHDQGELDNPPGRVDLFRRDRASGWEHAVTLRPTFAHGEMEFGKTLAMSETLLAVGATGESSGDFRIDGDEENISSRASGAVFVFRREGETWVRDAFLKASSGFVRHRFGASLSLRGDALLVGATGEDSEASGVNAERTGQIVKAGAAYLFRRSEAGAWSQELFIKPDLPGREDRFGTRVVLGDGFLAVSANDEDGAGPLFSGDPESALTPNSGAVYLFRDLASLGWRQVLYLKLPDPAESDEGASALALDWPYFAWGVERWDESRAGAVRVSRGAVYVFDATPAAATEVCDGFDDDLDGRVDETFAECPSTCVDGRCR